MILTKNKKSIPVFQDGLCISEELIISLLLRLIQHQL